MSAEGRVKRSHGPPQKHLGQWEPTPLTLPKPIQFSNRDSWVSPSGFDRVMMGLSFRQAREVYGAAPVNHSDLFLEVRDRA
jgi:hypothetical protein